MKKKTRKKKTLITKLKKWLHTKDGKEQKEINKQLIVIIISIFITVITVIGITYSAFVWSDNSEKNQNIVAGNVVLSISSTSAALGSGLDYPVPQSQESSLEPYTFTIKNDGNLESAYKLKVIEDPEYTNTLDTQYIYMSLDGATTINRTSLKNYENKSIDSGVLAPGESKTYDLRLWIIEDAPNSAIGKQWHGKIAIDAKQTTDQYVDLSGANAPVLADGMIPVIYDEVNDIWEKANINAEWYNYEEQMWANAVTTSVASYRTAPAGTEIPMDDINSMWVWIPRYKYKIETTYGTHADGTSGTQTEPGLIDIVFERNTETTGTDSNIAVGSDYYTHPAFTFGEEDLTGFWVGKFETSGTTTEPTIKPGFIRLSNYDIKTYFETSLVFSGGTFNSSTGTVTFSTNASNIYGLNTTNNTTNTHMAKNMEWGSVAYLSQSKYGKMGNSNYSGINKEIYPNTTYNYYPGFSSGEPSVRPSSTVYFYNDSVCYVEKCSTEKEQFKGTGASTTGTIYGIYDMNGGIGEYVMINYINTPSNSGFTFYPEDKYIDKVLIQGSSGYIKGDATGETRYWYRDSGASIYSNTPWYVRGGSSYSEEGSGIFSYTVMEGGPENYISFRTVLIP